MSGVARIRSSETLNEAGEFVNGITSSVTMVVAAQSLDKWRTDLFSGKEFTTNGLYRGVGVNCLAVIPVQGLAYGVNKVVLQVLSKDSPESDGKKHLSNGIATTVVTPLAVAFERVKVIQQLTGVSSQRAIEGLYETQSYAGFCKGAVSTWVRDYIWYLGLFGNHTRMESIQPSMIRHKVLRKMAADAEIGALVGAVSAPFDKVRAKMQADNVLLSQKKRDIYSTLSKTVRQIYQDEGLRGLLAPKGLHARMAYASASAIVMGLTTQEYPRHFPSSLHKEN